AARTIAAAQARQLATLVPLEAVGELEPVREADRVGGQALHLRAELRAGFVRHRPRGAGNAEVLGRHPGVAPGGARVSEAGLDAGVPAFQPARPRAGSGPDAGPPFAAARGWPWSEVGHRAACPASRGTAHPRGAAAPARVGAATSRRSSRFDAAPRSRGAARS